MERPSQRSYQRTSPLSSNTPKIASKKIRKKKKRRRRINWWLVAVALTPLLAMAFLVSMFLGRIETPRPALVLSPEQLNEIHQAQKAQHEHVLEIEKEQQLEREEHSEELRKEKHNIERLHHNEHHQHHHHHEPKKLLRGTTQQRQQQHAIPNILIFTHSINLLQATNLTGEDLVLQQNVQHTIHLHKGATVRFLTDKDCIDSIKNVFGQDLVEFFQKESQGMYKADICRGAALYETGGLYFDVDLRARFSVWDAISPPTAKFVVPRVHFASKHRGAFFQAFIGATPSHEILYRYMELFVEYYQGKIQVEGPLGVVLLKRAHDEVVKGEKDDSIVLWQEVLYKKEWFPHVPPPNWGTRRACHFVVVANVHKKPPFVVPFYSRVKGSRMCGGKDSKGPPKKRHEHDKDG